MYFPLCITLKYKLHSKSKLFPSRYQYSYRADRFWRKNRRNMWLAEKSCIGTDLNRNFEFHWEDYGSSLNPCTETYRGPQAASEPETRAIAEYMGFNRHIFNVS